MSALVYRAKLWNHEDWMMVSVDGQDVPEDTLERMEAVIDSTLGCAPHLQVEKLNDEGEWEELG